MQFDKQKETYQGIIYQAISGFYYIWANDTSYATKPRGNFRHQQMKPLVGDQVIFEVDEKNNREGRIIEVLPRHNQLIRPSIVNVHHAFVVMSLVEPNFSFSLLDTFLVSVEQHHIEPIIILTKYDLLLDKVGTKVAQAQVQAIRDTYSPAKYRVVVIEDEKQSITELNQLVDKGIYVVMGQSGVGKSTLLNKLLPQANIETGEISDYLNRGRHTTREVTLYRLNQGLLADTPGFSALEFDSVEKEELAALFPEIWQASEHCKFRTCLHQQEPDCQVKCQVESGGIAQTRYQSYCQLYDKIEQRKPIYNKRKKG